MSSIPGIQNSTPLETQSASPAKVSLSRALFIWGLAALFYFYDYLLQVSPAAMKPELMSSLVKDAEEFGSLSAYCLYAYGIMQIPAGVLMDRWGPRKIITLACILCATGSLVFGIADSILIAKIGRVLIGAGAGFALISCLKIVCLWFPRERYALMTGATVTIGFLGAAFGLAFVGKIIAITGWREAMYWGGAIGLALSVVLWRVIKEKPDAMEATCPNDTARIGMLRGLSIVAKDSQTWIAALFAGLMFVPTLAFAGLWGIPFLVEAHGYDRSLAGICTSLIYVGWMFGGAFWGFLSDYWGRRNLPMLIANLATFGLTIAIIYVQNLSPWILKTLLFGLGFCSSAFIVAFAVLVEIHPIRLSATVTGFGNAINTLWGALAQPFIGFLLDVSASSTYTSNRIFSLTEYKQAFLVLPVCLFISFLFLLGLKETYCQRKL